MRSLCLAAALAAAASTATAQSIQLAPLENVQAPPDNPEGAVVWLPNYHFHLNMAHLSNDSPRYNWDANYGGEFGIVAVGRTQLTFVANYQAVLGDEFHPFDPNQGNYTIDGVLSSRVKGFYVAAVFHHLSRHLADRAKRPPVDWNMFGGRVGAQFKRNGTDVEARFDLLGAILKTNVDYDWEMHAGVRAHHRVYGTVGLIGSAMLREVGTNGLLGNRGTQTGGRGEGGLRVSGKAATVELYLAVERVIDPYPTEFGTASYASVGMRLLTR
ncbi:MAG TPA: hypothetical protein VGQ37_00425 [Vicinamibacterales bacterium]|jgi:hypothetical protein|nr:hypothetical protein [Vicinamibacterales bacterium]